MNGYEARFGGIRRLFGDEGSDRLHRAHVCVVGLGGVGSWAVEALARSGIGQLTLVDFDDICISNSNRQLHALTGDFGKPKAEVMAQRVQVINPDCAVVPVRAFFTARTVNQILATRFDCVVDTIDDSGNKCLLIAHCHEQGIPLIVSGGAGGRRDPTRVRITDLAFSSHDRLLAQVRSCLRAEHGFPRGNEPFGVECVFSPEPVVYPAKDGSVCAQREGGERVRIDCDRGLGTAAFVTGTFGFVAAAHVVRKLIGA